MAISRVLFLDDLTDDQVTLIQEKIGGDYEVVKQGEHGWTESAYIHIATYIIDDEIDAYDEFDTENGADEKEEFIETILDEIGIHFRCGEY